MIQKGKMTPTTCSLCGQQLTMGIAHICQKQTLTHTAVGYSKIGMTAEEKWEELRKWLCGLTINSPWCGGGGWDTAMLEVLVKMEEIDTGREYPLADDCIRIAKKYGMF